MAHHGGVYHNADIFVKCRYFYVVLISQLFSKMAAKRQFWDSDLKVFSSYFKPLYIILIICIPKCSKLSRGFTVKKTLRNIQ